MTVHIEYMPLADLLKRFHPENPKDHDLGAIITSLSQFGYITPGVIDENTGYFVDGNGRTEAVGLMQRQQMIIPEGIEDRADDWYLPVVRGNEFKSYAEAKAYLVTANRLTEQGGWDDPKLADLLQDLKVNEFALFQATGYDGDDLDVLLADLNPPEVVEDPGGQIDRAGELQKEWQTERGQLWVIPSASGDGGHRVMCGDSTCAEDVDRLMGGVKAQGCFTSPPYAMQRKDQYGGIPTDEYVDWWEGVQERVKNILKDDGSFFINIKPHCEDGERVLYVFDMVLAMRRRWGWRFIDELCWTRVGVPKMVKYRFKNAFEPIYQFSTTQEFKFRPMSVQHESYNVPVPGGDGVGDTNGAGWQGSASDAQGITGKIFGGSQIKKGMAYPSNLIKPFSNDKGRNHPASFASQLVEFFIKAYSDNNDLWFDPFIGSGTTIVACEQTGRIGYGMEIDPGYTAVALERLAGMGLTPRLEMSGGQYVSGT